MASMMLAGKVCSTTVASDAGAAAATGVGGGARDRHAIAGADQVDHAQAEEQREGGDDFEIEDRLAADAAHVFEVAAAGDPGDQRARTSSGAMMERIRRRKIVLMRPELFGEIRREDAQRHAGGHADKDPGRQRNPFHRSPHLSFWRSTSKNIMRGGRISSSEWCELWQTTMSCSRMGVPTCPSMVR